MGRPIVEVVKYPDLHEVVFINDLGQKHRISEEQLLQLRSY